MNVGISHIIRSPWESPYPPVETGRKSFLEAPPWLCSSIFRANVDRQILSARPARRRAGGWGVLEAGPDQKVSENLAGEGSIDLGDLFRRSLGHDLAAGVSALGSEID